MATSHSLLPGFVSFLSPSKPPPKFSLPLKLGHPLSLPSQPPHSLSHKSERNSLIPLAAQSGSLSTESTSVLYPSVANANILFFNSSYNVQVVVDENEHEERLLNRFRREVMRAGVIQECKRRRFHENKQDERKRKTREAAKRNRRRRPFSRFSAQNKREVPTTTKKDEDDEDNWDLPEGDLPY